MGTVALWVYPKPEILVILGPTYWGVSRDAIAGGWWLGEVNKQNTILKIHPSNLAVYVWGTNRKSVDARIYSYSMEGQTKSGEWVRLIAMSSAGCVPFMVFEPDGLRKVSLADIKMLDHEVSFRTLKPGESFEGLALFDYPKENAGDQFTGRFRFTISELEGGISETEYTWGQKPPVSFESGVHLQGMMMTYLGSADLSSLLPEYVEH
jgi:hypothetical protein